MLIFFQGDWIKEGKPMGPAIYEEFYFIHDHDGPDGVMGVKGDFVPVRFGKLPSTDDEK